MDGSQSRAKRVNNILSRCFDSKKIRADPPGRVLAQHREESPARRRARHLGRTRPTCAETMGGMCPRTQGGQPARVGCIVRRIPRPQSCVDDEICGMHGRRQALRVEVRRNGLAGGPRLEIAVRPVGCSGHSSPGVLDIDSPLVRCCAAGRGEQSIHPYGHDAGRPGALVLSERRPLSAR